MVSLTCMRTVLPVSKDGLMDRVNEGESVFRNSTRYIKHQAEPEKAVKAVGPFTRCSSQTRRGTRELKSKRTLVAILVDDSIPPLQGLLPEGVAVGRRGDENSIAFY